MIRLRQAFREWGPAGASCAFLAGLILPRTFAGAAALPAARLASAAPAALAVASLAAGLLALRSLPAAPRPLRPGRGGLIGSCGALLPTLIGLYLGVHAVAAVGDPAVATRAVAASYPFTVGLTTAACLGRPARAAGVLLALVTAQAALALWCQYAGIGGIWSGTVYRAGGTFGHPMSLYLPLAACLPLATALAARPRHGYAAPPRSEQTTRRVRGRVAAIAAGTAAVLTGAALTFTWYRGGILAAALALTVLSVRRAGRRPQALAAALAALLACVAAAAVRAAGPENATSSAYSLDGRRAIWAAGAAAFLDRPLCGVGPDRLELRLALARRGSVEYRVSHDAKNVALQFLAELGIPGGLFLAAFVLGIGARLQAAAPSPVADGVAAAWVAVAAAGLVDVPFCGVGREAGTAVLGGLTGITLLLGTECGGKDGETNRYKRGKAAAP